MTSRPPPIRRALVSVSDKTGIVDFAGVTVIRAAAKNHEAVTVVTDPSDYAGVVEELASSGGAVGAATRRTLARKAYALTAAYDAAIADWMAREEGVAFPETMLFA